MKMNYFIFSKLIFSWMQWFVCDASLTSLTSVCKMNPFTSEDSLICLLSLTLHFSVGDLLQFTLLMAFVF